MKDEDNGQFTHIEWLGDKEICRPGIWGAVVDFFLGRRVIPGPKQFVVMNKDGRILSSADGITWTMRTKPEQPK